MTLKLPMCALNKNFSSLSGCEYIPTDGLVTSVLFCVLEIILFCTAVLPDNGPVRAKTYLGV